MDNKQSSASSDCYCSLEEENGDLKSEIVCLRMQNEMLKAEITRLEGFQLTISIPRIAAVLLLSWLLYTLL